MVNRRKVPSTRQTQRVSRDMRQATIGSHVEREPVSSRKHGRTGAAATRKAAHGQIDGITPSVTSGESRAAHRQRTSRRQYVEAAQNRARKRRWGLGAIIVIVIVALAVGAGILAFRGTVASEMALRDSDASQALVSVRSEEPYYALISVELGAVAAPLDHAGPDVLFLARVDRANKKFALVGIPASLQVSTDAGAQRLGSLATRGDAALIKAVSNVAKVDISHYVKVGNGGVEGIVDALGGIDMHIDQVIDDPHAGDVYLPVGDYTLNGASAITFLRADNLRLGASDQLQNQVNFAAALLAKLLSKEGNFAQRIEAVGSFFQTDLALSDIESVRDVFGGITASDISTAALPGYITEVTGVADTGDALFVASSDDMAAIIASIEAGEAPDVKQSADVKPADPASFTVEVQNGTNITGAAGVTSESLKAAGFNVVKSGNAEQPIYEETLVIYKGAEGPSRAKAVIDVLGIGRAVSGDIYYSFEPDVLVIVGSDYKPFA